MLKFYSRTWAEVGLYTQKHTEQTLVVEEVLIVPNSLILKLWQHSFRAVNFRSYLAWKCGIHKHTAFSLVSNIFMRNVLCFDTRYGRRDSLFFVDIERRRGEGE